MLSAKQLDKKTAACKLPRDVVERPRARLLRRMRVHSTTVLFAAPQWHPQRPCQSSKSARMLKDRLHCGLDEWPSMSLYMA